ncbi:MAG: nucleotidyltransferase domain-containing protein [Actinobacteria bacterium]|nr:nucleotidyltransferase domain-containing protein [Actinomycetota bacterium]MBU1494251.1 nucleotidyltransferase domain-containing protein [Actinomycetota bacterium]MBU1865912.1 nucleotidyltransferase domain-containing protein [Actinomycetota bacterium]
MRLLAAMCLNPGASHSVSEWAAIVGVGTSLAAREVSLAENAGILRVHRVGTSKIVTVDQDSPFSEALRQLLMGTFGVPQILAETLRSIPEVEQAYLFGSWAARLLGEDGLPPNDIDLMIIGSSVDRDRVYEAVDRVSHQFPHAIQIVFRTPEQWADVDDSFIGTVRSRPIIPIVLSGSETEAVSRR